MSLEIECGWTLLRAITVSLIATPLAAVLARGLETGCPRQRRRRLLSLAIPFLTPGFVVGYAYSNITLDLVRQPILNELFYDLLLLIEVVPVGTLVLLLAPPAPLGPTAAWCRRLAGPDRLRRVATCGWPRGFWYGPARNRVPAFGLMALLVFHEFEIASLFRVIAGQSLTPASWSNALFELIALQGLGQQSPCIDGPGDSVNHASIGGQEVAGDVATVLLQLAVDVDDGEVPDLFMCGDEVLFDVPSNYPV